MHRWSRVHLSLIHISKEAGISIVTLGIVTGKTASDSGADAVILRLTMNSAKPRMALTDFLSELGKLADVDGSALSDLATTQDIFDRERAVITDYQVVPLAWAPHVYGLSGRVRDWTAPGPAESWPFADVWLEQPAASTPQ